MIPPHLELVAFGDLSSDPGLLDWLGVELSARFGFANVSRAALTLREEAREPGGERYHSNWLVDDLIARSEARQLAPSRQWTLAVTEVDLLAPGREFVFGEATVEGGWALVSLARFRSTDPAQVRRRALVEAVHELGHLAGLDHCADPACAMAPSYEVPQIDRKGPDLCPHCHAALPGR